MADASVEEDEITLLPHTHPKASRFRGNRSVTMPNSSTYIDYRNKFGPSTSERILPSVQLGPLSLGPKSDDGSDTSQPAAVSISFDNAAAEEPPYYMNRLEQRGRSDDTYAGNGRSEYPGGSTEYYGTLFCRVWEYLKRRDYHPDASMVLLWNNFYTVSCLLAFIIDPLFFLVPTVQKSNKCVAIGWSSASIALLIVRSMTDFIYLMHMFLQFNLGFGAPDTRVFEPGALDEIIEEPKKLTGLSSIFIILPVPQIMLLRLFNPKAFEWFTRTTGSNLYFPFIMVFGQDVVRLISFLRFLAARSGSVSLTDWAFAKFHRNLIIFVLCSHSMGSCWYLFGLARVSRCLYHVCRDSGFRLCPQLIHCGYPNKSVLNHWKNYTIADYCFAQDMTYGIFDAALILSTFADHSFFTRFLYSLFWGLQQISTMAGNLKPGYFWGEIIFTMVIIGLGILSLALLIGNLQNLLQGPGQRTTEMSMRRRVVAQWMSDRRLPLDIQREVREAERFRWVATRGVKEETLLEDLPEDLQRRIRRHLFTDFFEKMKLHISPIIKDDRVLDSFCERVKQKTYMKGSKILDRNGIVEKMVFIVRGSMESVGEDGSMFPLGEGDACGEELLTWCLENFALNQGINKGSKGAMTSRRSRRSVKCVTNVEAFTLSDDDIEETIRRFKSSSQDPRIPAAIRFQSPYWWQALAVMRIQLAWKLYRMRRIRLHGSAGAGAYPADASTSSS